LCWLCAKTGGKPKACAETGATIRNGNDNSIIVIAASNFRRKFYTFAGRKDSGK
jgi:hypothetical protein